LVKKVVKNDEIRKYGKAQKSGVLAMKKDRIKNETEEEEQRGKATKSNVVRTTKAK